ncbi:hypothetical protein C8Q79DRAFT_915393 [Trametes meyenii]|nr:hypothetical protein C8Q79DRAFT_915393 [Trametes meyenii]
MNTDPQHLTKFHEFLKDAKIPNGTEEGIAQSGQCLLPMSQCLADTSAGFARYGPGDCVIGRDLRKGNREETDELLSECFDKKDVADLWAVRDDILGPDELRTPSKAVFQDGIWSGGVAWERDPLACCVQNASRCYTAAFSHQVPKTLTSPTRGVKTNGGILTPHHLLRKHLIDVTARIGVRAMTLSAPAEAMLLQQRAEALNFPRIGNSDNYYFSTMQLNLTPAQGPDAATASAKFVEDLGHFGGKHTDNGDALPAFSNLVSCSDLRGNERPGIFVLLTLGLYIYTLANVGNNVTIELPREAIDPQYDNVRADVTPTSIAADGHVLTSADALMNYLGRALAQLAHKVMGEVCSDFQVSIDTTQFLQSISYVDPAAVAALSSPGPPKRLQLKPWDLAPRSAVCSEVFGCTRQDVVRLWNDAYRRKLPFFPESSDSGLWAKYNVFSDQPLDVNENGLAVAMQKGKSRAHPAPVNAGKKSKKRGRANSDLVNVNNIGRVQTIHSITFNNPTPLLHGPPALPPPTTPHRHSKRARAQNPGSSPEQPLREYINNRCHCGFLSAHIHILFSADAHHSGCSPCVADNELDTDGSENDRNRDRDPDFYPTTTSRPHLQLKKTKGPTLLSSRRLAKLLAPLDARSICEEETDPPYQGLQAMSLAATEVDSTQHKSLLSIFALERFHATINRSIVRLEKERPTFISTSMSASRTMYQVLHHSGKPAQFSADYGPHLATLWTAVNYQRERFTFHEVQIAMLKSEHMLAITAAWTWLDVDIPSMLYWLLQYPEKAKEQTAWLKSLLKDVQAQLLLPQERRQPLQSSKYLVLQENKEYTIKYNNHLPLQRNGSSMHDLLVKFTREALLLWLKFPSGQGQLQAGFIRTLLQHFHNPDVLLLPGMHDVFCRVRGSLLPASAVCGSRLGLNSLDDFSKYLSTQPLATPESPESAVMKNISERLEVFRTQWRQLEGGGHSASSYRALLSSY